ncbi:hypothetical protein Arub01_10000 [Actinomadura rubrobrunea]|uniref:Uncharacterized protein n=1 Tax=Actinomadura rubrobrunea TaxID=115335 RepID=A0A9W6PT57_9ACTN|nr:hypothetical protein Arub01_10000 [Actinomadura rubrobrunea]
MRRDVPDDSRLRAPSEDRAATIRTCTECGGTRWTGEPPRCVTCDAVLPPRPPSLPHPERSAPAFARPEVLEIAVHAASYLGVAALGGIIGNRADAAVVELFRSVHRRWRRRTGGDDRNASLDRDEAVDAAKAAVLAHGYEADGVRVQQAEQDANGDWTVVLAGAPRHGAMPEHVRVRVPKGDPAEATILIMSRS